MKITVKMLSKHHPCKEGLARFKRRYPKGLTLTASRLMSYTVKHKSSLDDGVWLIESLFGVNHKKCDKHFDRLCPITDDGWGNEVREGWVYMTSRQRLLVKAAILTVVLGLK